MSSSCYFLQIRTMNNPAKSQKHLRTSKLSQSKKFSALSLRKDTNGTEKKNDVNSGLEQKGSKRSNNEMEFKIADKKCKLEQDPFEDDLFDDINLTQILKATEAKPSDKSKQPENNRTLNSTKSEWTQLLESSHILKQLEGAAAQSNSKANTTPLTTTKSENLGDMLNKTNRQEIANFFDQVENSVLGLEATQDERIAKIVRDLFTQTQHPLNQTFGMNSSLKENNLTLGEINTSFASALKEVFLNNIAREKRNPKISLDLTMKEKCQYVEAGPFHGLPLRVKELIKQYKGIEELYEWQNECLQLPAVQNHSNLIYALPTSGGKTLVAEILMLREILCYKRNAIFILPYVAIVQEKVWGLSPFAVALDFLVEEYAASKGAYPPRKRRRKNSIYIATIEKALGLINSLIEAGRINEIGLIVVDELHLIAEQERGSTLEALLTKIMFTGADIQVVAMSATIGNVEDLCAFLNADIYTQNFRPVELVEFVKCGAEIAKICYSKREEELLKVVRKLHEEKTPKQFSNIDPDMLGVLVMEVIPNDSCLIFCHSKKNCENVAYLLCKVIDRNLTEFKKEERAQIKQALKDEAGSLCKILNVSIQLGIAYHHSGLTNEERRVIEDAFRAGTISVICCTSTLAAGVNLPAKRVILRQPYIGRDFINLSKYKQMVGRAGRAGLGETGESILICNNTDLGKVRKLLHSPMDDALSSMHDNEGKGLRRLILSCIGLGIANTRGQLQEVAKKTLLFIQNERLGVNVKKLTDKVIADLFKLGALQEADLAKPENNVNCDVTVRMDSSLGDMSFSDINQVPKPKRKIIVRNDTKLVISTLGCAAAKGNFELTRAHMLYDDLHEAQKSLVLLGCLHLLYLVTPYDLADQIKPNKSDYYNIYCKLEERELHTARILGIDEAVAMKLLTNQPIKNVPERVLNRFYLTLVLYDLWNEKPLFEVSEKFQINRGIVQHLMTGAATFASNVVNFCEQMEQFWNFSHLIRGMSQRLSHCCVKELMPLMELPAVKQSRAKQLYNAGFKTIQNIAVANPEALVESVEHMSRKVAKQLIAAAKMLLLEKVENLREEAEDVLNGAVTAPTVNQTLLK